MDFTLNSLRKEAEKTRKQLEDIDAAIRVMERLSGDKPKSESTATVEKQQTTLSATGKINLEELNVPKNAPKRATLNNDIRALVQRFGNQEFSINHIEAALKQLGKGSDSKHFKNRIYVHVRKLLEEGLVIRTFKGAGNDPHKFKLASKSDNNVTTLSASSNKKEN